ncbi:hypothetical protein SLS62_006921 [Diatrype stigma]|uniref:Extradiol ring-cleavage dioxygenase class III enzyme subunit B domain-containing protein n=1 Tax=Diatrype stigma TaxID=117547 RepID=A0AAN9UQK1_9PEZI
MPSKAPVYFFSHGGPDVQYNTRHPVYPILQNIGKEITQKVKPKAIVVFSGHWEGEPNTILVNKAEHTELIYDFYGFPPEFYKAQYPHRGDPELAFRIMTFHPEHNPLNVPIVQVSLYMSEDPDKHYRLGQAVSALRDEGVVIIGAGMSVHNLRDYMLTRGQPTPLPYSVSFDEALKDAVEAPPQERQVRMAVITGRPDARQAHPRMDHLMPVYVAAGAAGNDVGKRTWTLHEGSFAWAQYRFGDLP